MPHVKTFASCTQHTFHCKLRNSSPSPVCVSCCLQACAPLITCRIQQTIGQVDLCGWGVRGAVKQALAGLPLIIQQLLQVCCIGRVTRPIVTGLRPKQGGQVGAEALINTSRTLQWLGEQWTYSTGQV
jgi:hypothetical protein